MEWIETTGKTVEEAVERALVELGIDEEELEYEVVQEPRSGLLGIGAQRAHVRARVRPVSREKPERGRRRGGGRDGGRGRGGRGRDGGRGRGGDRGRGGGRDGGRGRGGRGGDRDGGRERERAQRAPGRGDRPPKDRPSKTEEPAAKARERAEERTMSDVPVEEQAEAAEDFMRGLVDRFGLDAEVRATTDEERVTVLVDGDDLGMLIGREGATMEALRELVKTALQRQTAGHNARVSVDVGGYLARRREALAEFAREVAEKAKDSGRRQVLEPMSPPDRKVVHDAVNDVEGVTTSSEGEEPRRRVVIEPD